MVFHDGLGEYVFWKHVCSPNCVALGRDEHTPGSSSLVVRKTKLTLQTALFYERAHS